MAKVKDPKAQEIYMKWMSKYRLGKYFGVLILGFFLVTILGYFGPTMYIGGVKNVALRKKYIPKESLEKSEKKTYIFCLDTSNPNSHFVYISSVFGLRSLYTAATNKTKYFKYKMSIFGSECELKDCNCLSFEKSQETNKDRNPVESSTRMLNTKTWNEITQTAELPSATDCLLSECDAQKIFEINRDNGFPSYKALGFQLVFESFDSLDNFDAEILARIDNPSVRYLLMGTRMMGLLINLVVLMYYYKKSQNRIDKFPLAKWNLKILIVLTIYNNPFSAAYYLFANKMINFIFNFSEVLFFSIIIMFWLCFLIETAKQIVGEKYRTPKFLSIFCGVAIFTTLFLCNWKLSLDPLNILPLSSRIIIGRTLFKHLFKGSFIIYLAVYFYQAFKIRKFLADNTSDHILNNAKTLILMATLILILSAVAIFSRLEHTVENNALIYFMEEFYLLNGFCVTLVMIHEYNSFKGIKGGDEDTSSRIETDNINRQEEHNNIITTPNSTAGKEIEIIDINKKKDIILEKIRRTITEEEDENQNDVSKEEEQLEDDHYLKV